ncbi:hypothetical protein CCH79_00000245 [Gambusia affinis]|uniref:Uncharacterized protein n=1 Tax=Gambusia affinis TaxID=33528 RepID=A0A315VYJ8_GAMAF|nr:hypothetical protein CCH79_00000245 [Gambusia affinis]
MSPQLQSTVWGRTHRAGLPIIIDRSQSRQTLDTMAPCAYCYWTVGAPPPSTKCEPTGRAAAI